MGSGRRALPMIDGLRSKLGRRVAVGERRIGEDGEAVGDDLGFSGDEESKRSALGGLGVRCKSVNDVSWASEAGTGGAKEERRDFERMLSSSGLKNGSGSRGSICEFGEVGRTLVGSSNLTVGSSLRQS